MIFNSLWYYEGSSFECRDLYLYQNYDNELRIYSEKYSYES